MTRDIVVQERQDWEAEQLNEGAAELARQNKVDLLKSLSADTAGARKKKLSVKEQREATKRARLARIAAKKNGGSLKLKGHAGPAAAGGGDGKCQTSPAEHC